MTPSRTSGSIYPPRVVFLEPVCRKRNQSVDPIDEVAHRRAARDDDDTRGGVNRRAVKAQQPAQIDHWQNHAMQIGEPHKTLWRERHVGQVRHADDFTDVAELKSELAAREVKHNEIRRVTRVAWAASFWAAALALSSPPGEAAAAAAFGATRWVRLAIAALDVFGE